MYTLNLGLDLFDGFVLDCGIFVTNTLEILEFGTSARLVFPLLMHWKYRSLVLVQECGIFIANTLEIPQSCTEPSYYNLISRVAFYNDQPFSHLLI